MSAILGFLGTTIGKYVLAALGALLLAAGWRWRIRRVAKKEILEQQAKDDRSSAGKVRDDVETGLDADRDIPWYERLRRQDQLRPGDKE